jgi:hypothetical protein
MITVTPPAPENAVAPSDQVDKPWGHDETIALVLASAPDRLRRHARRMARRDLSAGESAHVTPRLLHRLRPVEVPVLWQRRPQTPEGREDVVQLEDRQGPHGTTAP